MAWRSGDWPRGVEKKFIRISSSFYSKATEKEKKGGFGVARRTGQALAPCMRETALRG